MTDRSRPSEPRWHGSPEEWAKNVTGWASLSDGGAPLTLDRMDVEFPNCCAQGMALATMVFYTAADYNTMFSRPHPMILRTWAHLFGVHAHWMTIDAAESAVHAHFETSDDGRMMPADVIAEAKRITGRADG